MDKSEVERAMMGGGKVFKKMPTNEVSGNRRPKLSDFLRGTHGSGSAKMRAGFKLQKALRNTKKKK